VRHQSVAICKSVPQDRPGLCHHPQPCRFQKSSAFIIRGLQFKPRRRSVDRAAREEMPDLARTHYNFTSTSSRGAPSHPRGQRGAVISRASPAGPFGRETSASSPTAKVVESSCFGASAVFCALPLLPAGAIAKISTLSCLSCKNFGSHPIEKHPHSQLAPQCSLGEAVRVHIAVNIAFVLRWH